MLSYTAATSYVAEEFSDQEWGYDLRLAIALWSRMDSLVVYASVALFRLFLMSWLAEIILM